MLYLLRRNSLVVLLGLLLLVTGCSGSRKSVGEVSLPLPYSALAAGGLVYDASFQYKDFQASGLLVIKRLEESQYHVVLVSKFGPSLMEFKLNREGIQWIKTFDQLKKKKVEKLLERDFRMLLLSALDNPKKVERQGQKDSLLLYKVKGVPNMQLRVDPTSKRVLYAENRGFVNPVKTKVSFSYQEQDIPQTISLKHTHVKMSLDLNLLKVNNAEK